MNLQERQLKKLQYQQDLLNQIEQKRREAEIRRKKEKEEDEKLTR